MPARARVLLVDDEEAFGRSTARLLETYGYGCVATADVDSAWKLLESETFDVVVSDICMKGNTALKFVKRLADSANKPPVILVTGYPSIDTAVEALELRLVAYLIKPFEISDLATRIEQALGLRATRASLERMRGHLKEVNSDLAGLSDPIGLDLLEGGVQAPCHQVEKRRPVEAIPRELQEAGLTVRERELVNHLVEGYRVSTIACRLDISPHTVRRHLKSIFLKLEVRSQAELLEKMKPWNP